MVDGLEMEMGERVRIVRVSAQDKDNPLAKELGLKMTPSFVLLDSDGREIYRVIGRAPDRHRVMDLIGEPGLF